MESNTDLDLDPEDLNMAQKMQKLKREFADEKHDLILKYRKEISELKHELVSLQEESNNKDNDLIEELQEKNEKLRLELEEK